MVKKFSDVELVLTISGILARSIVGCLKKNRSLLPRGIEQVVPPAFTMRVAFLLIGSYFVEWAEKPAAHDMVKKFVSGIPNNALWNGS